MPMKIHAPHWSPEWEANTPQNRLRVQELKARELDARTTRTCYSPVLRCRSRHGGNLTEAPEMLCRTEGDASRPKHRRTRRFVNSGLFDLLKSFSDLEARIAALPTQQDRGDAFEVFAEAYLATQKIVGAEEVWPADQVPIDGKPKA
jgi:hypothetical protein